MKVLFYVRGNHEIVKGGDLVQLESTAEALRKLGVEVDYSSDPNADLSRYDVVHIFNSPRFEESLRFLNNAKSQGKTVALSTIFWPKHELGVGIADSLKVRLAKEYLGLKTSIRLWKTLKSLARISSANPENMEKKLLKGADVLLPNSEGEMREISKTYGIKNTYRVVRNAIDSRAFAKTPEPTRKDHVLSVGRIETRKNSLELIEACREAGLHLKLIGGIDKTGKYEQACLKNIKEYGFEYLGSIPHRELTPYYYQARVHAIAAWYETPGLSSMEAACGGCRIVSTDRGSTREYFGDLPFYCDPFDRASIVSALRSAWVADFALVLREKISREYTWDLAAKDTLENYRKVEK